MKGADVCVSHKRTRKRIVALPDIHYPLTDNRALGAVEAFMADFKPDIIVYTGDQLQMDAVSHWLQDNRRKLEGQRLRADYAGFNTILDRHKSIAPHAHSIFILGNHEDWVEQYTDLHPEMEGYLSVASNLRLRERGFEIIPFGGIYTIGHLSYIHGVYTNENHAKTTVLAYRRNVRYGHTHDVQSYTATSPVDIEDRISASSVGCLCNINPHYMRSKPSRWQHGFNFAYLWPDGKCFTDFTVQIIGGKFVWNDKEYKG